MAKVLYDGGVRVNKNHYKELEKKNERSKKNRKSPEPTKK
jgi:hypothetical protein